MKLMVERCEEGAKGAADIGNVDGAKEWYAEHLNHCARCKTFEQELVDAEAKKGRAAKKQELAGIRCSRCTKENTANCPHIQSNQLIIDGGGRPTALVDCFQLRD